MKVKVMQDVFEEIKSLGFHKHGKVLKSVKNFKDLLDVQTDQYEELGIVLPDYFSGFSFKVFHYEPKDSHAKGILFTSNEHDHYYYLEAVGDTCIISIGEYKKHGRFIREWREQVKEKANERN